MEARPVVVETDPPVYEYSLEQRRIIERPSSARMQVTAAAGTGKTHTLIGRLVKLVEEDGLTPGDELLILSFSRAAVAEVRRRARALGSDARFIGASTFDSFASGLLLESTLDPASWQDAGYEDRIELAVGQLTGDTELPSLDIVRHVLVDEIQDLVGARANLVAALLKRVDCGFTVLGDPAQAIYDYERQQSDQAPSSRSIGDWLSTEFGQSLERYTLATDFRVTSPSADGVAAIGARLRAGRVDESAIHRDIRTITLSLPIARPGTAKRMFANPAANSAVLTRTNGEALWISRHLAQAGVSHRLQRRAEDKAVAAWLSQIVAGEELRIHRQTLLERLSNQQLALELSPEECARALRLLDPGRGNELDLRRVADRVRLGDVPEELNATPNSNVVVSTVHRAKGLEFDRVLLYGRLLRGDDADDLLEARIAYVALSRARRELWQLEADKPDGLRLDPATKRWVRRGFGPNAWKTYDVELAAGDVHVLHPAGSWLIHADVPATQQYIQASVHPGDPVTLQLTQVSHTGDQAYFTVLHDGNAVGVTSESFALALAAVLGKRKSHRWPTRIEDGRVELVDTVAGHESAGRDAGLGAHGMWARVRICGLASLTFGERN